MYIDVGSLVPNIPSTSRGLADEKKKKKIDGMELIRNKLIRFLQKAVYKTEDSEHLLCWDGMVFELEIGDLRKVDGLTATASI